MMSHATLSAERALMRNEQTRKCPQCSRAILLEAIVFGPGGLANSSRRIFEFSVVV